MEANRLGTFADETMVCFICHLPVDVWSLVMSMVSLKQFARLDSAAAGGATRTILHENIFPRSPGQYYSSGDKDQVACLWCFTHGVPIRELCLRCVEGEDRLLEVFALHRGLVRHIILHCQEREKLLRTLNKLKFHGLDNLVDQRLMCGPDFDLSEGEGLTAEEQGLCQRLKTIWFEGRKEAPSPGAIKWLTACFEQCSVLETVNLWDVTNMTTEVFQTSAFRCVALKNLHISACNVTNAMAQCIAESCKQLRILSISGNVVFHKAREELLSDNGLIAIAKGCPLIETVYMGHQSDNAAVLKAFAMHCPHLRTLSAPQCALSATALNALATRCQSLTSLTITWAVVPEECEVAEGLHKLEFLKIRLDSSQSVSLPSALQLIAGRCTALRGISLDGGGSQPRAHYGDIGAALVALAKANPNVKEFTLRGLECGWLELEPIATVAQCWPKLRTLCVYSSLPDAALAAFAQHCPDLTVLSILGTNPPITDHSIRMLAQHCAELYCVELRQAQQVTEQAFSELVRCCPQLTYLILPSTISQEAIQRISAAKLVGRVSVRHAT